MVKGSSFEDALRSPDQNVLCFYATRSILRARYAVVASDPLNGAVETESLN